MSRIDTGYDLSVTTFSPDGQVLQIEYAAKVVDNSGTVVGIKCKDGIVMGVEKLIQSKMMLPGLNRRFHSVHRHSGMGMEKLIQSKMMLPGSNRRFHSVHRHSGMGVEKLIQSKMMLRGSNRRFHPVHRHSGMGVEKLIQSKMMLPRSNRRFHSVHRHSGMGVEKLIQSKMMLPDSNRRFHSVHRHFGMVICVFFFFFMVQCVWNVELRKRILYFDIKLVVFGELWQHNDIL